MFFAKITSCFLSVLYTLSAAFAFIPEKIWYTEQPYTVEDSDSILFSAAVIADTHSDSSFFHDRSRLLRKIICGISHAERLPDALVIAGDISNATDEKEYSMLTWSMKTFNKVQNVLPAAGNHDTRASDTYEEAREYFCDFAADMGVETDKVYYSTEVNGYPFIVLGSEGQLRLEAVLSDEQLAWFENELSAAVKSGKPVFIVCHQPMYDSNNVFFDPLAETNHGIGAQSAKVEEIIRKYVPDAHAPVFFISGHLHWNYGVQHFDKDFCENLYSVNLPSVAKNEVAGIGMAIEVYPEKVLLRGINYLTQEWLPEFTYEVAY